MTRRRLPLGVLLPLALLVLVASLAVLQYRWVGAVSVAERDEMRQSLERRAREFASDFDRELTRTYGAFQAAIDQVYPDKPEDFAGRFEEWRIAAPFPQLIKAVYFARERQDGKRELYLYNPDTRSFRAADWPAHLATVQRQVTLPATPLPTVPGAQVVTMSGPTVLNAIPALLITPRPGFADVLIGKELDAVARREVETMAAGKRRGGGTMAEVRTERWSGVYGFGPTDVLRAHVDREHLVVEMDGEFVRATILPSLAQKHFPDERYRVAVVDPGAKVVLTRNLTAGATEIQQADVTAPFFMLRPDL